MRWRTLLPAQGCCDFLALRCWLRPNHKLQQLQTFPSRPPSQPGPPSGQGSIQAGGRSSGLHSQWQAPSQAQRRHLSMDKHCLWGSAATVKWAIVYTLGKTKNKLKKVIHTSVLFQQRPLNYSWQQKWQIKLDLLARSRPSPRTLPRGDIQICI